MSTDVISNHGRDLCKFTKTDTQYSVALSVHSPLFIAASTATNCSAVLP